MKLKFWGVRGSIPVPGAKTAGYGGNTTCIEVRTGGNDMIILDAGTGIFQLAQALLGEMPLAAHVFITHSHWDHIQGLPFFIPIFVPGNRLRVYGAHDFISGRGVEQVMDVQLQYSFFPIREAEMKASIEYFQLAPAQAVQIGAATVTAVLLNHPVINLGYRIDADGKSIFFTGDHEPYFNIYEEADESFKEYQAAIEEKEQAILDALSGVDVLIADTPYATKEYPAKKGWGHGHYDFSIDLAKKTGARVLYCTHHEPTRSDAALEQVFGEALARHPRAPGDPEYRLAREGEEIEV